MRIGIVISLIGMLTILIIANQIIEKKTIPYIYEQAADLPKNKVGLLLGTSKYRIDGKRNDYYLNRIDAAVRLYKLGKVDYILVSGDNSIVEYNEPINMRKDLIEKGVPDTVIVLDYAGFRTLDSVVRAHRVFGQDSFTIISQKFHNQRAVFIGKTKGLNIVAYNAQDVSFETGIKTRFRELFARVKVLLDLFVLHTQPKFLGEPIRIGQ